MTISVGAAAEALRAYEDAKPGYIADDEYTLLIELLTDLKHWASRERVSFEGAERMADIHAFFEAEERVL